MIARAIVAGVVLAVVLVLTGCEPTDPSSGGSSEAPTTTRETGGVRVTKFVDGDTIKTTAGTVRFIGIDTPERGQCGFREATSYLRQLVAGRAVTLTAVAGRDDHDRYGRSLRYVNAGGRDLGLAMIQAGYATSRYDSRDGYGWHPKQNHYVKADAATAPRGCPR